MIFDRKEIYGLSASGPTASKEFSIPKPTKNIFWDCAGTFLMEFEETNITVNTANLNCNKYLLVYSKNWIYLHTYVHLLRIYDWLCWC